MKSIGKPASGPKVKLLFLKDFRPPTEGVARDSFRQGVLSAKWCVLSCWIWMVLPLATTAHHQATMAAVTLWLFFERLASPRPPRWGWPPMLAAAAQIVRS